MCPESILIFSLSILVVRANSVDYANIVLARKNLHGEGKPSRPYLSLRYKNDNTPYAFRRVLQEKADPKIASIASAAADATLDITNSLAKEISDAIALSVADAVAKVLAEQSVSSRTDSENLSKDISVASDEVKSDSGVKHDSKYGNIEYRGLPIGRTQQEQPEVPYDDDNVFWPADNTNKFSTLPDTDQPQMEQRIYSGDETSVLNQDARINPNVEYQGPGVIILHHRNNSEPIHQHSINAGHHNHPNIDEQGDDDVVETHKNNNDNAKRNIKRRGRGRSHRFKKIRYMDEYVQ